MVGAVAAVGFGRSASAQDVTRGVALLVQAANGNGNNGQGDNGNGNGNNGNSNNGNNGNGNNGNNNGNAHDRVTICHAGSDVNPHFVAITIDVAALPAHLNEHAPNDFIVTPDKPCPPVTETKPPTGKTGELKICKVMESDSNDVDPSTLFTFSAGSQTVAVLPGTCTLLSSVPEGSVDVTETGPSGFHVTAITFNAGTGTPDVDNSTAKCNIVASQTTEVQFKNQKETEVTTTIKGFLQICKETTTTLTKQTSALTQSACVDPVSTLTTTLTGTFSFTSPSFSGAKTISVVNGATQPVCSPLIEVNAGNVDITEATGTGFVLSSVRTLGSGSLVNFSGTTATVNVVAGGPEKMTQVIFKNASRSDP